MKKILSFLAVFSSLISLGYAKNIQADGMVVPRPDYLIRESGQKAVIFYDKGVETLVVSINFQGDAKDFAWIVPTPQKPTVTKGSDEIFTSLETITQKYQGYSYDGIVALNSARSPAEGSAVTVVETKKIDYYDVAVLSATESGALAKWLSDNGYQYPTESAYILNDYINNNWYFVAVKISPEASGAAEVIQGLEDGHATPLKLEFASEAIIYPMRISAIEVNQGTFNLSDNLVLDHKRTKELKDIGYDELADQKNGPIIFKEIVQDLMADKDYSDSIASSYPLIIKERNFNAVYCYNSSACRSQVESWLNNYFSNQGLYYNSYRENYMPIYLYVIADGKKEIPGFSTDYANWIKAKEIRDLAYDLSGKSLLSPTGSRYYLTSLYRTMLKSDMTDDLVIRAAQDNARVNAPDPGKNALWTFLVALGIFFAWAISPLGLFFIIPLVIKTFVRSDILRTFAGVFQIISMTLTLSLLIFSTIMAAKFSQSSQEIIFAQGGTWALGLIFLAQIIVMLKTRKNHFNDNNLPKN